MSEFIGELFATVAPGISLAVGAAAAWFGVRQFVITKRLERQAPLWERQLEFYFEASEVAATLAVAAPGSDDWKAADRRFWTLWAGPMVLVESGAVEAAMVGFGDTLAEYALALDRGREDHLEVQSRLRSCALRLSNEMRASIASTLEADLEALDIKQSAG